MLTVDLWDESAQVELNLVVHPSSSFQSGPSHTGSSSTNTSSPSVTYDNQNQLYHYPQTIQSEHHVNTSFGSSSKPGLLPSMSDVQSSHPPYPDALKNFDNASQQHAPGSFTRNLIGSLVASAFKLHDTEDRLGIWFVLQDLSVRTEGSRFIRA